MSAGCAGTGSIEVLLDGQPLPVATGTTLEALVESLGHVPTAVSTAVNGEFVPRAQRGRPLAPGDAVLLFQPIVGG